MQGVTAYSSTILAAGADQLFDGFSLPDPSEQNWLLEVTSNDDASDPGQGDIAAFVPQENCAALF